MTLIDRIASWAGFERRNDAADPSWSALAPNIGYCGAISARAAENLSAVAACSTVIATSLASIPALVYRRQGGNRIEAMGHPLYRITRQGVNEAMTWPDFVEHMLSSALLSGNGLAEIMRTTNGALAGFRFIPWGMVTVVQLASGRLAFDVADGRGGTRRLLPEEVLHLRDRTDGNGVGVSRLSRAADVISAVQATNGFARNFLENGGRPGGVIKSAQPLTQEQLELLRSQFHAKYSGTANAGRTLILDHGMEWTAAQISPEDAELLESRKFGVEEICRLFQVPPPLVQDYSHNTFTNSETAGRWFAMFTLAPWARKIEAEFARSVFSTGSGFELELDLSGFLRGDPTTRWNAHKIALEAGVLTANEVREIEGWNPKTEPASEQAE
ncbi:phage portal protein [Altererythrobacter sp. B11]|uniref:phage portal protein n=1 Tax=Altererythrobacter sp. B11 TaxID=2060312 RepID=UPI000DC707A1|nr:phage portal protein [Altererythrobacter sp. B11]BBC74408.1 phage portal protein [Altererythrobacter sp. B11]